MEKYVTFSAHSYRFFRYLLKRPTLQLENGMFIVSIDVDVGTKELGLVNGGKNDRNVNSFFSEYFIGKIEQQAIPLLLNLFNHFEMPVTFALRGQLADVCGPIIDLFLESPVKHDIGAHGYSHKKFTELTRDEAQAELKMISAGMRRFGIIPKSFVFPRNSVAHLDLLADNGYKCYRGKSRRTHIEREKSLCNVHPSLCIDKYLSPMLLTKFVDLCVAKRVPFHAWFHPWNFGINEESMRKNINRQLFPVFKHIQRRVKSGDLQIETMLSAAEKVQKLNR